MKNLNAFLKKVDEDVDDALKAMHESYTKLRAMKMFENAGLWEPLDS